VLFLGYANVGARAEDGGLPATEPPPFLDTRAAHARHASGRPSTPAVPVNGGDERRALPWWEQHLPANAACNLRHLHSKAESSLCGPWVARFNRAGGYTGRAAGGACHQEQRRWSRFERAVDAAVQDRRPRRGGMTPCQLRHLTGRNHFGVADQLGLLRGGDVHAVLLRRQPTAKAKADADCC
jgi:hypothetical protein